MERSGALATGADASAELIEPAGRRGLSEVAATVEEVPALDTTIGQQTLPAELLHWGRQNRRDLPWRNSRDPWAVLVAEVMLQQTRADRVTERWPRFLARFPDVASCASALPAEVIAEWSGLGYNRRAVHLHRAAGVVMALHSGRIPTDRTELEALPGIGPYTARAIRAFAYEAEAAVVDTNVARILARWTGRRLTAREAQDLADQSVPSGQVWSWNQTLLDLGALTCTARTPDCGHCPLADRCVWRGEGSDPARGSAGVSGGQTPFEGSDRQGRGRLVAALGVGPVADGRLAEVMGWPGDTHRARRVVETLMADGLVVSCVSGYALPGWEPGT